MCMELLLTVLICVYHNYMWQHSIDRMFNFGTVFDYVNVGERPVLAKPLAKKFEALRYSERTTIGGDKAIVLADEPSLYGAILFTWYWMNSGWKGHAVQCFSKGCYDVIRDNHKELKRFAEIIKLIEK